MVRETKTLEKKDGTKIEYAVDLPESTSEAIAMVGVEGILQAVRYVLTIKASRLADKGLPLSKELRKLLKNDKELREMAMKKLKGE